MSMWSSKTVARQRGGAIGMLLSLLIIGIVLYLALRPTDPSMQQTANPIDCEQRISQLLATTGGVGPQAQSKYEELPGECQKLMPNPADLAPSPQRSAQPF